MTVTLRFLWCAAAILATAAAARPAKPNFLVLFGGACALQSMNQCGGRALPCLPLHGVDCVDWRQMTGVTETWGRTGRATPLHGTRSSRSRNSHLT